MLIVHVHIHVRPEFVEAFRAATLDNAQHSVQEPGIARFDMIEQVDDPTKWVLIEVYRTEAAPAAHKETAHYARWRDTVEPMMAEPRRSTKYRAHFPGGLGWEMLERPGAFVVERGD
jgi:(4S)-4-hydroxy-5-phosphonooxypentane-2,3-dione isomerase